MNYPAGNHPDSIALTNNGILAADQVNGLVDTFTALIGGAFG